MTSNPNKSKTLGPQPIVGAPADMSGFMNAKSSTPAKSGAIDTLRADLDALGRDILAGERHIGRGVDIAVGDAESGLKAVGRGAMEVGQQIKTVATEAELAILQGAHGVKAAAVQLEHGVKQGGHLLETGVSRSGQMIKSGAQLLENDVSRVIHGMESVVSTPKLDVVQKTTRAVAEASESLAQATQVDPKNLHVKSATKQLNSMKDAAKDLKAQVENVKKAEVAHVKSATDLVVSTNKIKQLQKDLVDNHDNKKEVVATQKELVKQIQNNKSLKNDVITKAEDKNAAVVGQVKAHCAVVAHSQAVTKSMNALHKSTNSSIAASAKVRADASHKSLTGNSVVVEHNCTFVDNMTIFGTLKKMETLPDDRSCIGLGRMVNDTGEEVVGLLRCKPLKSGHCPTKVNSDCTIAPIEMSKLSADSVNHLFS